MLKKAHEQMALSKIRAAVRQQISAKIKIVSRQWGLGISSDLDQYYCLSGELNPLACLLVDTKTGWDEVEDVAQLLEVEPAWVLGFIRAIDLAGRGLENWTENHEQGYVAGQQFRAELDLPDDYPEDRNE